MAKRTKDEPAEKGAQAPKRPTEPLELADVPVSAIVLCPDNPRIFDPKSAAFRELVDSVRGRGVMLPVHVRPHPSEAGAWDLRCGERRVRAAREVGLVTVPAVVHRGMSDEEAADLTATENLDREDLKPVEEGNAVRLLLRAHGQDVAAVAAILGRTERWVLLRQKVADLTPAWQKALSDPGSVAARLTVAHLQWVARLGPETQDQVLAEILEPYDDGVGSAEEFGAWINAQYLMALKSAPWKLDDVTLDPKAGSCGACQKRSSCQPGLFDASEPGENGKPIGPHDRCLDRACWVRRMAVCVERRVAAVRQEHGSVLLLKSYSSRGSDRDLDGAIGERLGNVKMTDRYEVQDVKKGEPGAVPAVFVEGGEWGQLRWVKPRHDAGGGAGRKVRPMGPDGKAMPTPLADRRKALGCRRWALAMEKMREKIKNAGLLCLAENRPWDTVDHVPVDEWPQVRGRVIALAAAFGTGSRRSELWNEWRPAKDGGSAWKVYGALLGKEEVPAVRALWAQVKEVLDSRLTLRATTGSIDKRQQNEVREEAALVHVEWAPFWAEIEKAIPEPKGWARLNADGTPKAAAKLGAKGKSQEKPTATETRPEEKAPKGAAGTCRVCGCTEDRACEDEDGAPCGWTDATRTLCSACEGKDKAAKQKRRKAG